MRIAIIGAGSVGGTLARRWAEAGHEICLGLRKPEDPKYAKLEVERASVKDAAASSDIIVLATPWPATEEAIRACGSLTAKRLIDCTNPLQPDLSGLTHSGDDSGGEQVKRWAVGAHVAKAFNSVGANIMADPVLEGRRAVMPVCGDDAAKSIAIQLSESLGFETIDAGPLESARFLESLALVWISAAYRWGLGRDFAFSIVRS